MEFNDRRPAPFEVYGDQLQVGGRPYRHAEIREEPLHSGGVYHSFKIPLENGWNVRGAFSGDPSRGEGSYDAAPAYIQRHDYGERVGARGTHTLSEDAPGHPVPISDGISQHVRVLQSAQHFHDFIGYASRLPRPK